MIKINYKIKKVRPKIYAIIVPDSYHRAMLFLRCQEFYESPNPKFRGKDFNIWEYVEWYSKDRGGKFTYGGDWSGFNIPMEVMSECLQKLKEGKNDQTPYDKVMIEIFKKISILNGKNKSGYVIGSGEAKGDTFMHEVAHGLYYTDPLYNLVANQLIKKWVKPKHYQIFKKNLLSMGYTNKVIDDEIQAYLLFGYESSSFGKGVSLKDREIYSSKLTERLGEIIYEGKSKRTRMVHKEN